MSPRTAALAVALLAAFAAPVQADVCAFDRKPGATLLIPYFEVDLGNSNGPTTAIWIRNAANRPKLANVVLWTRWNVPAFAFTVYLRALGRERVDIGRLLRQGVLPVTGPALHPVSDFDTASTPFSYGTCNNGVTLSNTGPGYPPLDNSSLSELQARFSGVPTPASALCFSPPPSGNLAQGYITVDSVSACPVQLYPDQPGYFLPGGVGYANNENVLLGGFELLDPASNFAAAAPAVSLEADDTRFVPGSDTFYGAYSDFLAIDGREPLPYSWALDFDAESSAGKAELLVWRAAPKSIARNCAGNPNWYPLGSSERTPFDRSGNTPPEPFFPLPVTPIGYATQRIDASLINDSLTTSPPPAGSARLNFTHARAGAFQPVGQSWVGVLNRSEGRFSELTPARALDSGCMFGETVPAAVSGRATGNPPARNYVFIDGLES